MSTREELTETSKRLKDSIEHQFDDLKDRAEQIGKISLWVGGGLLAVLVLSKIFGGGDDEETEEAQGTDEPKKKNKKPKTQKSGISKPNFLTDTLKQQAILFALGLAAKQLKSFLKELEEKNEKRDSE